MSGVPGEQDDDDMTVVPPPPLLHQASSRTVKTIGVFRQLSEKIIGGIAPIDDINRQASSRRLEGVGVKMTGTVTCMVCCEEFSRDLPHYSCEKNSQFHCLCITCFADYVNYSCESWATLNTIPIRCQIPDCGYEPDENVLKRLLNDPLIAGRNLWDKYTQTQLKVALAKSNPNSQEVPVTCAFCGKYAEFYVKAAPDYWQKTEKGRFQSQIAKEQALYEATKKLKEEMDQKIAAEAPPQGDEAKKQFDAKKQELFDRITSEIEHKMVADFHQEPVDTSQFFVCRGLFCDGAYCLICETFLKKPEMNLHMCIIDPVEKLYQKVLEVLATSASRTCPTCGTSGMKDLACTHITCDKCQQKFCYVCGVAETALEGGFGVHNQWELNGPPDAKRCPMYLHFKWGNDGENPAAALDSFHRELQTKAIEALKTEVNDESLWNDMVQKKFEGKPIVAPPVYFDPNNLPPEVLLARERAEQMNRIHGRLTLVFSVYMLLYTLFFYAMYTWMIHAGRTNLNSSVRSYLRYSH
jgi:hypothetical protein